MPLRDSLLHARPYPHRLPLSPAERLAWARAREERLLAARERLGSSRRQLARSRLLLAALDERLGRGRLRGDVAIGGLRGAVGEGEPWESGQAAAGDRGRGQSDRCG